MSVSALALSGKLFFGSENRVWITAPTINQSSERARGRGRTHQD